MTWIEQNIAGYCKDQNPKILSNYIKALVMRQASRQSMIALLKEFINESSEPFVDKLEDHIKRRDFAVDKTVPPPQINPPRPVTPPEQKPESPESTSTSSESEERPKHKHRHRHKHSTSRSHRHRSHHQSDSTDDSDSSDTSSDSPPISKSRRRSRSPKRDRRDRERRRTRRSSDSDAMRKSDSHRKRTKSPNPELSERKHYVICVPGLTDNLNTIGGILKEFSRFGEILAVQENHEKGYALIEFANLYSAFRATDSMHQFFNNQYIRPFLAVQVSERELAAVQAEYERRKEFAEELKRRKIEERRIAAERRKVSEMTEEELFREMIKTQERKIKEFELSIDPVERETIRSEIESLSDMIDVLAQTVLSGESPKV